MKSNFVQSDGDQYHRVRKKRQPSIIISSPSPLAFVEDGGDLAARKWRVKFMRRGWEPPYPFGKSEEVVIAASRREAIEIVMASGVVSPGYKVSASPVKALEQRD